MKFILAYLVIAASAIALLAQTPSPAKPAAPEAVSAPVSAQPVTQAAPQIPLRDFFKNQSAAAMTYRPMARASPSCSRGNRG